MFCRFIVLVGKKNGAKVVMVKVDPHDAILTEIIVQGDNKVVAQLVLKPV